MNTQTTTDNITAMLKEAGIHIIPASLEDLDYRCDCESDHHTCSHIVATYMALGNQVNADPLLLFLLRGKTRDEIAAGVSQYTNPQPVAGAEEAPSAQRTFDNRNPSAFWRGDFRDNLERRRVDAHEPATVR